MAINLPLDPKLSAAIQRRRIAEEDRKARIFNAKQRTIGIDIDGLNHQLHDNKIKKQQDEEKEQAFVGQLINCDKLALKLQKQQQDEVRNICKEIDDFRLNCQRIENRREFDIYDPDRLKKESPPRKLDDDSHCSLSGLQKLEGEDLNYKERTKKQKEDNRQSLIEQMKEKRMQLDKQNSELHNLELKLLQLDTQAHQLALQNDDMQKKRAEAVTDFNLNLARQQRETQRQQQMSDDLAKLEEIYNTYYGDLLSESKSLARSSFGPHRVVPDRYKGMSEEQLNEYHQKQKEQIVENQRKREKVQQNEALWDDLRLRQDREAVLLERNQQRQTKQVNRQQVLENSELAQAQKQQQDYIEKVVYSNVPTQEFYAQFNTTTR